MKASELTEHIGSLIGQDKLKEAMDEMRALLSSSPRLDELILQSARYNDLTGKIRMGTVSFEEADISKNRIRFALLDLLREVENGANSDPDVLAELERAQLSEDKPIIRQTHSGSGDNVGGDKVINNG